MQIISKRDNEGTTLKYTSPGGEFVLPTLNLQQWDFFFVFAFIIGLYSLHRLSMIKEVGEVEEKVVMNELFTEVRTQVRTLSSAEGVKNMISVPILALKTFAEKTAKSGIAKNRPKE